MAVSVSAVRSRAKAARSSSRWRRLSARYDAEGVGGVRRRLRRLRSRGVGTGRRRARPSRRPVGRGRGPCGYRPWRLRRQRSRCSGRASAFRSVEVDEESIDGCGTECRRRSGVDAALAARAHPITVWPWPGLVGGSKGERLACAGDTFDEVDADRSCRVVSPSPPARRSSTGAVRSRHRRPVGRRGRPRHRRSRRPQRSVADRGEHVWGGEASLVGSCRHGPAVAGSDDRRLGACESCAVFGVDEQISPFADVGDGSADREAVADPLDNLASSERRPGFGQPVRSGEVLEHRGEMDETRPPQGEGSGVEPVADLFAIEPQLARRCQVSTSDSGVAVWSFMRRVAYARAVRNGRSNPFSARCASIS